MATLPVDLGLVEMISLVLVHFVWQACVLVAVAAIGFILLSRSPSGRYAWGVFCLAGFTACPLLSICFLQPSPRIASQTVSTNPIRAASMSTMSQSGILSVQIRDARGSEDTIGGDRKMWLHLVIVSFWLFGQLTIGCRLLISGLFVFRLRRMAVPVPNRMQKVADTLATRMQIRCRPIMTATYVHGAMAAGFLRQMIVIPAAWLTELSPEMLEAVVAHELAHFQRHDVWVNLFQRLVETIFFFHPAVWWLSRRVRADREICCDLLAIKATKRKKTYAETLEHVAQLEAVRSALVLTLIGDDRMSLLRRVRLVLGQQPAPASRSWWPAGALAIAIPVALLWLHTPSIAQQRLTIDNGAENSSSALPDTNRIPLTAPLGSAGEPQEAGSEAKQHVSVVNRNPHQASGKTTEWTLGEYIIEPPDIIRISIDANLVPKNEASQRDFSYLAGKYLVGPDGSITLGDFGSVHITGMTIEKAATAVRAHLGESFHEPQVSLDVFISNSKCIHIIEDRDSTGDFITRIPVTGNETVLDAIAQIGGFGQASSRYVYVKRPNPQGGEQILPVNWEAITRGAATSTNYQLLPGDRLFISKKTVENCSPIGWTLDPATRSYQLRVLDEAKAPAGVPRQSQQGPAELTTKPYYVGDLVVPIPAPQFTKAGKQERDVKAKPDFATLVGLVSATVAPDSWEEVGGSGILAPFEGNLSLVVSQTEENHQAIAELFDQLRRLQESKITLHATRLRLPKGLMEQLGMHGKPITALTSEEQKQILRAASRSALARTFAETKANLFNGQFIKLKVEMGILEMQPVLGSNDQIRLSASLTDPKSSELVTSAVLYGNQALLARTSAPSEPDAEFLLITAEPTEAESANSIWVPQKTPG